MIKVFESFNKSKFQIGDKVEVTLTKNHQIEIDRNTKGMIGVIVDIIDYGNTILIYVKFDRNIRNRNSDEGYTIEKTKWAKDLSVWFYTNKQLKLYEREDDSQFEKDDDIYESRSTSVKRGFKKGDILLYNEPVGLKPKPIMTLEKEYIALCDEYGYDDEEYFIDVKGDDGNIHTLYSCRFSAIENEEDDEEFEKDFESKLNEEYDYKRNQFEVGDRVKCIQDWHNKKIVNELGVIKRVNTIINCVEFDNYINGHNKCGKNGHCWNIPQNYLILDEPEDDEEFERDFESKLNEEYEYNKQKLNNIFLNAVKQNNIENVQWALEKGANVKFKKNAAIYNAVYHSRFPMVKLLIKYGADPQITKEKEYEHHIFSLACYKGNIKIIDYLFNLGADIRENDNMPINNAIITNNVELANYLIKKGIKLEEIEPFSLGLSIRNRRFEIVKYFVENNYKFNELLFEEIHTYMRYDQVIDIFSLLLDKNAEYIKLLWKYVKNIPELKNKYNYLLKLHGDFEFFN